MSRPGHPFVWLDSNRYSSRRATYRTVEHLLLEAQKRSSIASPPPPPLRPPSSPPASCDGHPADRLGGGELPRPRRLRGAPLLPRLLPRRPLPPRPLRLRGCDSWLARRLIFEKGDEKLDLETYAGRRKIRKFKESAWKCIYFLSGELLALYVTYNEPWFMSTRNFWVGPGDQVWPDQRIKLKLKAVYMYVAGFYTYSIFALLFWETRRSDFGISMAHHVSTVFLIALSYIFRFARVGSVVLAIHDASDVFLELGKISKYSGCELLADASFLLFVSSWVVLRLIYFPFRILWSTSYEVVLTLDKEKHKFDGPIYYYVFNSLLFSLLVLHIYWWVLMYRMLVRQIQSRGHVGDDIRSDSEGEEEHED